MVSTALLLISLFLQNPDAIEWLRKGQELIGTPKENSEQQARYFEKAVELDPELMEARYNLSLIYMRQQKFDRALPHLTSLISLQTGKPEAYLMRAQVRIQAGDFDSAVVDLESALNLDAEDAQAWAFLADLRLREEQYAKALEAWEKVHELDPESERLYLGLAMAQQNLGRQEEAVQSYLKFLSRFPDDFRAHFFIGILYREQGRSDLALEHFLKAEAQDQGDRDLAQGLANLYLDLKEPEAARKRLLRSDLEAAVNIANLGIIATQQGRYLEAETYFRRAVTKEPQNGLFWVHLGDALGLQKKEQEAAQAYETGLRYEPGDFDALFNLGKLYVNRELVEKGIQLLRRALDVDPSSGPVHFLLAMVLDQQKDFGPAQAHYLKAIENGADETYAHFRLAILFALQFERESSLKYLETAFQREPEKYVPVVIKELRRVHSDLDTIRYTEEFADLLAKYRDAAAPTDP